MIDLAPGHNLKHNPRALKQAHLKMNKPSTLNWPRSKSMQYFLMDDSASSKCNNNIHIVSIIFKVTPYQIWSKSVRLLGGRCTASMFDTREVYDQPYQIISALLLFCNPNIMGPHIMRC